MIEREKHVDEVWKETVAGDKQKFSVSAEPAKNDHSVKEQSSQQDPQDKETEEAPLGESEVIFLNYVASLGCQAMIFLGEMPHPMTNEYEKNPEQAKLLIDTLIMLREKTKGNLTRQEVDMLNTTVYELQMKFLEASKEKKPA